jgi:hypothetical protein
MVRMKFQLTEEGLMTNPTLRCPEGHIVLQAWYKPSYSKEFSACIINLPLRGDILIEAINLDTGFNTQISPSTSYKIYLCEICNKPYFDYQCTEDNDEKP